MTIKAREATHIEIEDTPAGVRNWVEGLYTSGRFPGDLHLGSDYREDGDGWRVSIVRKRPLTPDEQREHGIPDHVTNATIIGGPPAGILETRRMGEARALTLLTCVPASDNQDFPKLVDVLIEATQGQAAQPAETRAGDERAATINKSGGVEINANTVNVYRDVVGRDKIDSSADGQYEGD